MKVCIFIVTLLPFLSIPREDIRKFQESHAIEITLHENANLELKAKVTKLMDEITELQTGSLLRYMYM